MVFKGSRRLEMGELAGRAEAAGGDVNAYTTSDSTYYHLTCLPEGLESCFDALADSVWCPRFDEGEVRRERGVVLAEIDRAEDQPDQSLQRVLFRRAYGKCHPFGPPILGTRATVSRFDRRSLQRYHRAWYAPSNSVVVVAGPVTEAGARRFVGRSLRGLPGAVLRPARRGKGVPPVPPARPEGNGPRTFSRYGRTGLARLELAFAVPSFRHRNAPALEVLSMILGVGDSARLYQRLCVEKNLMHEVSTDLFFSVGPGLFFIGGLAEISNVEAAAGAILRIARGIAAEEPPREEELERVRLAYRADLQFRRESVTGRARIAGYFQLVTGDPRFASAYLRRVETVGADDVRRAVESYLRPEFLTAGVFLPESARRGGNGRMLRRFLREAFLSPARVRGGGSAAREVSPPKGRVSPPRKARASAKHRRAFGAGGRRMRKPFQKILPGGARLLLQPGGASPIFSLRAVFLGGQRLEGESFAGLHALMTNVATEATSSLDSVALARRLDEMAASLSGYGGRNSFGLSASGLSSVWEEMLEIFVEALCAPAFDPEDIRMARREAEAERRSDRDDLAHLARLRMMELLYEGHPFARHPLGRRATLAKMDAAFLRRAWRRWTPPENLVIAAAGEIDPVSTERRLRRMLRAWAARAPKWKPPRPPAPPRPLARPRRRRCAVESASQSHILLGFLGAHFHDPRRYALGVAAAALGSQGGGLFMELRERRGLAYAVNVSSEESIDPGPFTLYAATAPGKEEAALSVMRSEIARIREQGLAPEELARAKAFLIGEHVLAHQRASARSAEMAFNALYGLGEESPDDFLRRVEAVDAGAVRAAAREMLAPERACLLRLVPRGHEGGA